MLRFYFEVARNTYRRQVIYPWANFSGLLTNIFFGAIFSYVIIALYQARPVVGGYDVLDTLRYTWLLQALVMVTTTFGWIDLIKTIQSGEVVTDLSKPCDFHWYWFSREIGRSYYYLIFRALPIYVAGMLIFQLGLPGTWLSWLCFVPSLVIGAMIGITYRYLYNVIAFWLIEARAFSTLALVIAQVFTGSYVPLPLFPDWLRTLASWLPFYGLMNLPTEILLDKISGPILGFEIGRQLVWLFLLILFVRWLTALATRRVIVQGG